MVIHLQVAIFFFMKRPSAALLCAFCIAQLISSIITAYGNWGFTTVAILVWVWVRAFLIFVLLGAPCADHLVEHGLVHSFRLY